MVAQCVGMLNGIGSRPGGQGKRGAAIAPVNGISAVGGGALVGKLKLVIGNVITAPEGFAAIKVAKQYLGIGAAYRNIGNAPHGNRPYQGIAAAAAVGYNELYIVGGSAAVANGLGKGIGRVGLCAGAAIAKCPVVAEAGAGTGAGKIKIGIAALLGGGAKVKPGGGKGIGNHNGYPGRIPGAIKAGNGLYCQPAAYRVIGYLYTTKSGRSVGVAIVKSPLHTGNAAQYRIGKL